MSSETSQSAEMPQQQMRVFLSWQSDGQQHRTVIKQGLADAAAILLETNIDISLDEATRGTSGSPDISMEILKKIEMSDVFVADISTINGEQESGRKCPNPNVVFELGYAVAMLGWERVILLFNESTGKFPDDVPFDLQGHLIAQFPFPENTKKGTPGRGSMASLMKKAIAAIADSNPKRPSELKGLSPDAIRKQRDLENLRWVLSTLHFPTVDMHLQTMPHQLNMDAVSMWEEFNAIVSNSLFHLYDTELKEAVWLFHTNFHATVCRNEYYHETPNPRIYVFSSPGDVPLSGERQSAWDMIEASAAALDRAKNKLLEIVRERYLEIDVKETNAKAYKKILEWRPGN